MGMDPCAERVTFAFPMTNVVSWKAPPRNLKLYLNRYRWFVVRLQQQSTQVSVSPSPNLRRIWVLVLTVRDIRIIQYAPYCGVLKPGHGPLLSWRPCSQDDPPCGTAYIITKWATAGRTHILHFTNRLVFSHNALNVILHSGSSFFFKTK